jgi:hypothetical protein
MVNVLVLSPGRDQAINLYNDPNYPNGVPNWWSAPGDCWAIHPLVYHFLIGIHPNLHTVNKKNGRKEVYDKK